MISLTVNLPGLRRAKVHRRITSCRQRTGFRYGTKLRSTEIKTRLQLTLWALVKVPKSTIS